MGLFSFLFGRHKKEVVEEEDGLELGMEGAEVTPISIKPTATAGFGSTIKRFFDFF